MAMNPNSLKNLEGHRADAQNFYTKIAARFNWLLFQVRGARGNISSGHQPVYMAMQSKSNFASFSIERQEKIKEIAKQQDVVTKELTKLEALLMELPTTPLRSPEAREAKLKRRREIRNALYALKKQEAK